MQANHFEKDAQLAELMASASLAAKFLSLFMVLAFTASTGGALAGAMLLVWVLAWRLLEQKQAIDDPAFTVLLAMGGFELLVGVITDNSAGFLLSVPLIVCSAFYGWYSSTHQPFANCFAKAANLVQLRQQLSQIWVVVLAVAAVCSVILPLSAADYWLWLAGFAGVGGHVWAQFFAPGKVWESDESKVLGDFVFRRLPADAAGLKPFYDLYYGELTGLLEGAGIDAKTYAEKKFEQDRSAWHDMGFFAAYHNDRMVGTCACMFDVAGQRFPVEDSHSLPLSLDSLRKMGGVAELARLCVVDEYRMSPEVLAGLMLLAMEYVMSRRVSFIVLQATAKSARMYSKMGFSLLRPETVCPLDFVADLQLFVKNLVVQEKKLNPIVGNLGQQFSPYVLGRYSWYQIYRVVRARILGETAPLHLATEDVSQRVLLLSGN